MQNLQTLTRKYEGTAIVGLLVIGIIAMYHWTVGPHLALLVASQRYERVASRRIETCEAVNEEVQLKRDELTGLLAERSKWSHLTFDVVGADEFLAGLQALCREAGCARVSVSYFEPEEFKASVPEEDTESEEEEPAPVAPVVLVARGAQISVEGRYENVVRLIELFRSRREKVWVDRLEISSLRSSPDHVSCELGIRMYVTSGKEMEHDE